MKKNAKLLALFLALMMLLSGMAAATEEMDVVEPTAVFYVADYANVLSDETENYIVNMNDRLEELTGGQIVVVTMEFLGGKDIEAYAYNLMNQWGIGDAQQNNGVLLLLSVGEADYWAMAGSGITLALTASLLGDYLNQYLEPDFATGNYDAGVTKFFDATLGWFGNFYAVDLTSAGSSAGSNANANANDGLLDPSTGDGGKGNKNDNLLQEDDGLIHAGNLLGKIAGTFLVVLLVLAVGIFLLISIPRTISLRRRGYRYGVFSRSFWSHRPPPPPRRSAPGPRPGGMGHMGGAPNPGVRPGGMGRMGGSPNPGVRPGGMGRMGGGGVAGSGTGRSNFGGRPTARSSMSGGSRPTSRPVSRPRTGGGGSTRGGGAGRR